MNLSDFRRYAEDFKEHKSFAINIPSYDDFDSLYRSREQEKSADNYRRLAAMQQASISQNELYRRQLLALKQQDELIHDMLIGSAVRAEEPKPGSIIPVSNLLGNLF